MTKTLKHLIAIVGMAGSGKGTCSDYLEQNYPVVHFGKMVVEEVEKRGLEINEANERIVREDLRKQHGPTVMAMLAEQRIAELSPFHDIVIIDGLYSWDEYKFFEQKYDDRFTVIAVFTPRKDRYERLTRRGYRSLNEEEAKARDVAEIENLGKGGPIARADYTLVNTDTPTALQENLVDLLRTELGIEPF